MIQVCPCLWTCSGLAAAPVCRRSRAPVAAATSLDHRGLEGLWALKLADDRRGEDSAPEALVTLALCKTGHWKGRGTLTMPPPSLWEVLVRWNMADTPLPCGPTVDPEVLQRWPYSLQPSMGSPVCHGRESPFVPLTLSLHTRARVCSQGLRAEDVPVAPAAV